MKAALVEVKTAALSMPSPISHIETAAGGGLPAPHQQPGGEFIHWVTYAVTTDAEHGETAVTVACNLESVMPKTKSRRRRPYSLGHGRWRRARLSVDNGFHSHRGGPRC